MLSEMKLLVIVVCCLVQFHIAELKVIPDRLPQPCSKSVPNFSECTSNVLKKLSPYLVKGVREINFPKMTPLDVPLYIVNRTINNFVGIDAVMKNMQLWGLDQAELDHFKFDVQNMNGELHIKVPHLRASLEYDAKGRLLDFVYDSAGYFKGNFTNLGLLFKFSLTQIDKLGVEYYSFENFKAKGTVGNGFVKVVSKTPEGQAAMDAVVDFSNKNFQTAFNVFEPIYDESSGVFYKAIAEQVLNTIPAKELIPE